ncbi:MAG: N-6 DNA methylase [Gammaproteobacteria bacterium]|nr:N-6 DNA methylase [Gammaproteobacteria bacterium]
MPFREDDAADKEICTTAALVLTNACLLHRRLRKEEGVFDGLTSLEDVAVEKHPAHDLKLAWRQILRRDYRPVFKPALAVANVLDEYQNDPSKSALQKIVNQAVHQADKLSTLGYDYAGPLYHKVLKSAKSDGAFYTKNTSALLLAGLALPPQNDTIWSDGERVRDLKVIDPACGTGTLLMAALSTIKRRSQTAQGDALDEQKLHKALVENGIYGMDINAQAIQMAASNLTFGATSVDYRQMNLHTLPHGPQEDGSVKAGALEILVHDQPRDLVDSLEEPTALGEQVDGGRDVLFPERGFDLAIMNPPFTNNQDRGLKHGADFKKVMGQHELAIADMVLQRDGQVARDSIHSNSIGSYFEAIGHRLLDTKPGATLAMVLPITKCTSASGEGERKFLASAWRIDYLVVCHQNLAEGASPSSVGFTSNEKQFECLLVARRKCEAEIAPSTKIIHLDRHPRNEMETANLLSAIESGDINGWGLLSEWPVERIEEGDWSCVAFRDQQLMEAIDWLYEQPQLMKIQGGGGCAQRKQPRQGLRKKKGMMGANLNGGVLTSTFLKL